MDRVRCGPAITPNDHTPTSRDCLLVFLSRRICKSLQYFRARRPRRTCLAYRPIQPIRQLKAPKPTLPRGPRISSQTRESRSRRSRPCSPIRPSQPIRSSLPSMGIPPNRPMFLPMLYICILSILFRIPAVIRLGATPRQVASAIQVALLVLTSTAGLFRQRITSILRIMGGLSAGWPTTGYDTAKRIGGITIHSYDLGAKAVYYTRAQSGRGPSRALTQSGGCPIHGFPTMVGIPDRGKPNVVRARWGYTDSATDNSKQVLKREL